MPESADKCTTGAGHTSAHKTCCMQCMQVLSGLAWRGDVTNMGLNGWQSDPRQIAMSAAAPVELSDYCSSPEYPNVKNFVMADIKLPQGWLVWRPPKWIWFHVGYAQSAQQLVFHSSISTRTSMPICRRQEPTSLDSMAHEMSR